ncbi:MAG TPA: carboxypeptidase regulatory-like domain-containing protein [Bryobacteraceae bacterium]|nr:carboxypeptidase regulatory-like domain-containing protein [Bryobacteraceae bacterium]
MAACLAAFVFPRPVSAQVLKGQILGTISDQTGAVIPAVKVTITETRTNFQRTGESNDAGNFFFVNLDPGDYTVEAEKQGFSKTLRSGVELLPNTTARVNFELVPGAVTQVVDVSGSAAPLLQTDRADTGGKIETAQLVNMPMLYNRNYQSLLVLVPGVGKPFRPHSEFYNSQDSLSVRVNGQGRQFNNFQIEGIENKIDNGNLTALVPPAEAIQTVDVSTSNFDPEFGNAGGAVTNVTLKSGANDFHGSLFEFHRNENIQARNTFAATKAPTVYNQFGGTIGGRILRDKLFFFADYQGSRDHLGQVNRGALPGAAFRSGDLSGASVTIYDPLTGSTTGAGRTAFPGNRLPANRISPIAQKILGFTPLPNIAAPEGQVNYSQNSVRVKTMDQMDSKVDWVISSNDRLAVRYSLQESEVFDPGLFGPSGIYGGFRNGGFGATGPARTQSAGVNYSKVLTPTLVWESRVGVVRNRNDARASDTGLKTSEEIGIRGVNLDDWTSGLTEIRVNGYASPLVGFSPSLPWARSVTSFGIVNNISKTFSKHILRFGVDIRRERNDLLQTQTFNPRGRFEYQPGQTGDPANTTRSFANAFAAFLLDVPNLAGRDLPFVFPARRELTLNFYIQDKWQLTQKLTVDLGLRLERERGSRPRFPGGYSNYNPVNNTLELSGLGNVPINIAQSNNNWGPRIGIAYRMNEKTVMRTGFGISFFPRRMGQTNFPILQNNAYQAPNAFAPATVTMTTGFPPFSPYEIPSNGIITNPPLSNTYTITPYDLASPYVQSWNFAVQRALPWKLALDLAYVGNKGVNNQSGYNLNASMIPGSGNNGRPLFARFGRVTDTTGVLGTSTWYNGLQVKVDRRVGSGLFLTTAYTFSKGLNYTDDDGALAIPIALQLNRGRMSDNRTHVFTQSYMWSLPFGKGKRWAQNGIGSWLAGGWQIQGLFSAMTGSWFSPSVSGVVNAPGNSDRPNLVAPIQILGNTGPGQKYFDISSFATPAQNTLGNAGRNIIQGPGLGNFDAALHRNFAIKERMQLALRLESFNFTNTAHYMNPNGNAQSPQFGEINSAEQDQRQFQIGLTLRF